MKTKHLAVGVGMAIAAVLVVQIFSTRQKKKKTKKKVHIANEGYETAEDILYPRRGPLSTGRAVF